MKRVIAAITSFGTMCVFLSSCGFGQNNAPVSSSSVPESVPATSISQASEQEATSVATTDSEDYYAEYLYILDDTQRVGEEGKGFVDVPTNWVEFRDVVANTDFQYSNISGTQIITMNQMDFTGLSEEQISQITVKACAEAYWQNTEAQYGEDAISTDGNIVDLNGREAYQVYTFFQDDTYLAAWFSEGDDGNIYTILAEGPNSSLGEMLTLVEKTYNPTS